MIEFALYLARDILSNVFTDLILKNQQEVRVDDEQVQGIVIRTLRKQRENEKLQQEQIRSIVTTVISEIATLSERHPNLQVGDNYHKFSLQKPIQKPSLPFKGHKKEWKNELERLDQIIAQRKQELISSQPQQGKPQEGTEVHPEQATINSELQEDAVDTQAPPEGSTLEWEPVNPEADQPEKRGYWAQQLIEMDDRIQRRRRGELVVNEDE